jgi:hypothetical protein
MIEFDEKVILDRADKLNKSGKFDKIIRESFLTRSEQDILNSDFPDTDLDTVRNDRTFPRTYTPKEMRDRGEAAFSVGLT